MRKVIVGGCLIGASFFIGCNSTDQSAEKNTEPKQLEMYEESELALLMRKMYAENIDLKQQIIKGELPPEDFARDFENIHSATPSKGMLKDSTTFQALAKEYIKNIEAIRNVSNTEEAKIAYNDMIMTCASCHQVYCQGPLPKIRKMKINVDE